MSKHKHTDGLWIIDGLMVKSNSGRYVGYLEDFSDADVARVIACMNACKNLRNEQLNDLIQLGGISLGMLEVLTEQRDKYKRILEDHGPEGHNVTNQQYVDLSKKTASLQTRLSSLVKVADSLCDREFGSGHPTAYTYEDLLHELLASREVLGEETEYDSEETNKPDQVFADMCQLNVEYRTRLTALEEIATALEADIDCGRPLEYSVEVLRDELIRTREVLGMLPEQKRKERC